ncbi:uncharacterized protein PAC_16106 [Phialocephala subalpina]|uniref:2EXR domain-containing protein n=1 Tax=Phialocephala subalpina TaxID=576137 RepID=A0A1L7XMC8_9HELO|nr:uncharacterized protein PAC_16106 [Phialocephala subalpina]
MMQQHNVSAKTKMDPNDSTEKQQRGEKSAQEEETTATYSVTVADPKLTEHPDNSKQERLVHLHYKHDDGGTWKNAEPYYWSPITIPSVLHTCMQSRHEAKEHYELTFACRSVSRHDSPPPARIYFDPTVDILFITTRGVPEICQISPPFPLNPPNLAKKAEVVKNLFLKKDFGHEIMGSDKVRTVAVDFGVLREMWSSRRFVRKMIADLGYASQWKQLETFVVPLDRSDEEEDGDSDEEDGGSDEKEVPQIVEVGILDVSQVQQDINKEIVEAFFNPRVLSFKYFKRPS